MNSTTNYKNSSLNSDYSSKIVRPNTEKFGQLMDIAKNYTLAQVIKGETFGEGSGPLRQNIFNRIAVVKKMAYSGQYSIEDRENAINALDSRMKRWKKYNKNLQDLDFDLNVNYAVEALKPLRGQALIDAVNGKNKAENNCRMDYDSVFGKKESLVNKVVEAPPVIENSGVKMPDTYETKGFLRNLWSRVGDYVNDVKEGLKEKKLAFGNNYGKWAAKVAVTAALIGVVGAGAWGLYKFKSDRNEINKAKTSQIERFDAGEPYILSIGIEEPMKVSESSGYVGSAEASAEEPKLEFTFDIIGKDGKIKTTKLDNSTLRLLDNENYMVTTGKDTYSLLSREKENDKFWKIVAENISEKEILKLMKEKVQFAEVVPEVKPADVTVATAEKPSEEKSEGIEAKILTYDPANIKYISLGEFEGATYVVKGKGLLAGVYLNPNEKRYLEERARANSSLHMGAPLSRRDPKRVKQERLMELVENALGVSKTGDEIKRTPGLPLDLLKGYTETAQAEEKPSFDVNEYMQKRAQKKFGDRILGDLKLFYNENAENAGDGVEELGRNRHGIRNLDERVFEDARAAKSNLGRAAKKTGKALTHAGNISREFWEAVLFHPVNGLVNRKAGEFKKAGGDALGVLRETYQTVNKGADASKYSVAAGIKTLEILPDATIGNFYRGDDLTSIAGKFGFFVDDTFFGLGGAGVLVAEYSPLAVAGYLSGDAIERVTSLDSSALKEGKIRGLPGIHNLIGGTFYDPEQNITNTPTRRLIETAGGIWVFADMLDEIEDKREQGEEVSSEKQPGEGAPTIETSTETTTIRRPQRNPNLDFENNDDLIDRPGDIGSDPTGSPNTSGM